MSYFNETDMIPLMRPAMPLREELEPYLERIWRSRQLTNAGPIHQEFEEALCSYLGVEHLCLVANGTLALLLALKALHLSGEVITTPFTSAATLQAIVWNRLTPVFVDIDRSDLNIHPGEIARAMTQTTCAVVPVHVFGEPCDTAGIEELVAGRRISTVYDAAHCFGVKLDGIPVCRQGDLSVISFHATKVFNCIEGGAIVCRDKTMKEYIDTLTSLRLDHGLKNNCSGLNATLNEIQSAFGLVLLKHIDEVIASRKSACENYITLLQEIPGIDLFPPNHGVEYNYTYMPVIIDPQRFGSTRDDAACSLAQKGITTRTYFHPLVSDFPEFSRFRALELRTAKEVSERILCLPLYHDMGPEQIEVIVDCLREKCLA